ncbi:3'-5' exonuclease [Echinicola pacifica]|uniref:3'-5' exonuclease n=1 Tax=Echinicola pacifica TaxID=346377 RepID=A0A918PVU8_9BACT|nr:3'-5' exonuclease [Echinicola pacifica]GGZ22694.1 3'-5' exonuclease [Echinicola pacifica]
MADFFSELKNILFLDLETAASTHHLEELPERMQEEWHLKASRISTDENMDAAQLYFEKAGIYAEFGRVICIGMGYFSYNPDLDQLQFRTKSLASADEHEILWAFRDILEKKNWTLCAHNGKEFDFPYLCRRMLANRIPLPNVLQLAGKKPWELKHLDTLELWKFGDYKHYTRLELLASLFDIPSSKDDINGSEVNRVFYEDNNLQSIRTYCVKDVVVTAKIYLAFQGLPGDMDLQIIDLDTPEQG